MAQADLEAIRGALLQRRGAFVNLTGDERALQAAQPLVTAFLEAMPEAAAGPADWANALPRVNEAITVPTQARTLRGACRCLCLSAHSACLLHPRPSTGPPGCWQICCCLWLLLPRMVLKGCAVLSSAKHALLVHGAGVLRQCTVRLIRVCTAAAGDDATVACSRRMRTKDGGQVMVVRSCGASAQLW